MPFKSRSQWRKFGAMLNRGEISKAKFDEYAQGVDYDKLPERIGKKKKRRIIIRRKRKMG